MPVKGKLSALRKLSKGLGGGMKGVAEEVARLVAQPVARDAAAKYDAALDPYGRPRPLLRDGSPRRIYKSGKTRRGAVTFIRRGKKIETLGLPDYARYQNPRNWWPDANSPPDAWAAIVEDAGRKAIRTVAARTLLEKL